MRPSNRTKERLTLQDWIARRRRTLAENPDYAPGTIARAELEAVIAEKEARLKGRNRKGQYAEVK